MRRHRNKSPARLGGDDPTARKDSGPFCGYVELINTDVFLSVFICVHLWPIIRGDRIDQLSISVPFVHFDRRFPDTPMLLEDVTDSAV
jgi:hypothetical protein